MYIASCEIYKIVFAKFTQRPLWRRKRHNVTTVTRASRDGMGIIPVRILTRAFLDLPNFYEA